MVVESKLWEGVAKPKAIVKRSVAAAAAAIVFREADEICVTLTDDASIQALNRRWRHQDKPTNVLSFPAAPSPASDAPRFLGDIVLAFETIEREARAQGKTIDEHLAHLVVHGVLHLLGYDHAKRAQAQLMEGLETRILATIGVADPYAIHAD
jgi:probable rRNA maturation factor